MYGLTRVYQELGNDEWGQELFQQWWDSGGSVAFRNWKPMNDAFEVTRTFTLMDKPDEALDFLEQSVRWGWRGGWGQHQEWRLFAYYDISVDAIRDHPRFQAAIAVIEADMAQQLENVRAMQRDGVTPTLEELQAELLSAEQ